jgi:hypothetical protein
MYLLFSGEICLGGSNDSWLGSSLQISSSSFTISAPCSSLTFELFLIGVIADRDEISEMFSFPSQFQVSSQFILGPLNLVSLSLLPSPKASSSIQGYRLEFSLF